MFGIFEKVLRTGIVTESDPWAVPPTAAFRGRHHLQAERCDGCGVCVGACPVGAIAVAGDTFSLGWDRCLFCGLCAGACPREALSLAAETVPAARSVGDLYLTAAVGGSAAAGGAEAAAARDAAEEVGRRARAVLGRSLHVRHLAGGSCNACDFETMALLNPIYDAQRFGIDFVASPRHADVLLVTGPVTRHLETAVRRTYAAAPEPRLVVAVGACACGGGIHQTSYATAGGADRVLPVDIYVPGCPPRPTAILEGLLLAMGRWPAGRGPVR